MQKYISKKIISAIMVVAMILTAFPFTIYGQAVFSDIDGHWAAEAIDYLLEKDAMHGYEDGTVKPDNKISRAEFCVLVQNILALSKGETDKEFSDVPEDMWFAGAVYALYANGVVNGVSESAFEPQRDITRQEAAKIIAKAYGFTATDNETYKKFDDSEDIADWAMEALSALVERGLISGYGNGEFMPQNSISRGETAQILFNVVKHSEQSTEDDTPTPTLTPTPTPSQRPSGGSGSGGTIQWLSGVSNPMIGTWKSDPDDDGIVLVFTGKTDGTFEYEMLNLPAGAGYPSSGTGSYIVSSDKTMVAYFDFGLIKSIQLSVVNNNKIATTEFTLDEGQKVMGASANFNRQGAPTSTTDQPTVLADNVFIGKNWNANVPDRDPAMGGISYPSTWEFYNDGELLCTFVNLMGSGMDFPYTFLYTIFEDAVFGNRLILYTESEEGNEIRVYEYAQSGDVITVTRMSLEYDVFITGTPDPLEPPFDLNLFAGGDGSVADPFQIATAKQLDNVRHYLDKNFILIDDIDLSVYASGEGWNPIGSFVPASDAPEDAENPNLDFAFKGSFDGNGHKIKNMTINRPEGVSQALFGVISVAEADYFDPTKSISVKDITFENADVSGYFLVGTLAGFTGFNVEVDNIDIIGDNNEISGVSMVGGISGGSMTAISNCDVKADVTGNSEVGMIVGTTGGAISNCNVVGSVTAADDAEGIGGIAGAAHYYSIENCSADVVITTGDNSAYIGGLSGSVASWLNEYSLRQAPMDIKNNTVTGSIVTGIGSVNVGGITGGALYAPGHPEEIPYPGLFIMDNCTADVDVTGSANVGGLVGYMYNSEIENSMATGNVTGEYKVGGLVGFGEEDLAIVATGTKIINSSTSGTVTGPNNKTITVTISGEDKDSLITNGSVYAEVSISDEHEEFPGKDVLLVNYGCIGGLAGYMNGTIADSYSTSDVSAFNEITFENLVVSDGILAVTEAQISEVLSIGGLVGDMKGNVSGSNATGNVTAFLQNTISADTVLDRNFVGGLIGLSDGGVEHSFATGNVTVGNGTASNMIIFAAGLIGAGHTVVAERAFYVTKSYATGDVIGGEYIVNIAGLIGAVEMGNVSECYTVGDVSCGAGGYGAGGIVGTLMGKINDCYATGDVSGAGSVGGVVGWTASMTALLGIDMSVSNCYATGNVSGIPASNGDDSMFNGVGGVVGHAGVLGAIMGLPMDLGADVQNCFALNESLSGATVNIGRIAGATDGVNVFAQNSSLDAMLVNSGTVLGAHNDKNGADNTETALKTQATFESAGWLFGTSNPWTWDVVNEKPVLTFQLKGFSGGDGSIGNPFQIESAEQLTLVHSNLDKNFILIDDIDLSVYASGEGWNPIGSFVPASDAPEDAETPHLDFAFLGTFDGDGHCISNITINAADPATAMATALFGCVAENGNIKDLDVKDVTIVGGMMVSGVIGYAPAPNAVNNVNLIGTNSLTGTVMIGGIIGGGMSNIVDCSAVANITANGDYDDYIQGIGILAGGMEDCSITNCYAEGSITVNGINAAGVGGLAGCAFESELVENCEANVTITVSSGTILVGGLLGFSGITTDPSAATLIKNCKVTATINATGASRIGGIVGGGFYIADYASYYPMPSAMQIVDCEANGTINGGTLVGSIIGYAYNNSTVSTCSSDMIALDQIGATDGDVALADL